MSFISKVLGIDKALEKAVQSSVLLDVQSRALPQLVGLNKDLTIYAYSRDKTFIEKGYQKNAWVYAIVSKCAKKFGQVPFYHYQIKTSERKTYFNEYIPLTKLGFTDSDPLRTLEAKRMLKKSVDQVIVNSPLSKFLAKPNRAQSGAKFRENLYGYMLLTGEGNTYLSRLNPSDAPVEMFVIPKDFLAIVKGGDAFADIEAYKLLLGGNQVPIDKQNIIMWTEINYNFDPLTLQHLRGQSPLDAGLLVLQSSNEAAERQAAMNKNQGAAGLLYPKASKLSDLSPEQASFMRKQVNSTVNDRELAGQVALLSGDWGYLQFGLTSEQLQLIEQTNAQFKALCNIYDVPWQLFGGDPGSYENRKQYKREFVYDKIAVAAHALRDEWNAKLIPQFGLDRERDVIDCDILSLPELGEDLQTRAKTVSNIWVLTPNEQREQLGFDKIEGDPNMDKLYIPVNVTPLDQANADPGAGLDQQLNLLNNG